MIYFIQAADINLIKIGYSANVPQRLRNLSDDLCDIHLRLRQKMTSPAIECHPGDLISLENSNHG